MTITAIMTNATKRGMMAGLLQDYISNKYFLGVGKSDPWNDTEEVPKTYPTKHEEDTFRLNMQSIKIVESVSFIVKRINWSLGSVYYPYDNTQWEDPLIKPYYVITDENNVFICIEQGKNNAGIAVQSTEKPNNVSGDTFKTNDGYSWRYLFTLSAFDANTFLSANFMPVKKVLSTDESSPASDIAQEIAQNNAVPGEVLSIAITNAGTDYISAPTVEIIGDGSGAEAEAVINNGKIVSIKIKNLNDEFLHGSNYNYADVVISGGGGIGGAARAVLSSREGLMKDPLFDLNATALMFVSRPNGDEEGEFVVDNSFRQIALIKNIELSDGTFIEGSSKMCLDKLNFQSIQSTFTPGKEIIGVVSGARGFIDKIENNSIFFHQNDVSGLTKFQQGEQIVEVNSTGEGILANDETYFVESDINKQSGLILYIQNRPPVLRDSNQTEDLKIIIGI